jgi:hypothetical protein
VAAKDASPTDVAHVKVEPDSPLGDIILPALVEPIANNTRRLFYINSTATGVDSAEPPLVIKSMDLIKQEEEDCCLVDLDRLTDLLEVGGSGGSQQDCWESASAMSTISSNSSHFEFTATELDLDMLPGSLQEDYDWMDNIMRI